MEGINKPNNLDVINSVIKQLEKSKYKPKHVKYFNGKEWVEIKDFK